jgi:hypothetical protein
METVFETAGRAYGDGILVLQQEHMEMMFWNYSKGRWRWCFGTAARADGNGVLELQQEQMEMVI